MRAQDYFDDAGSVIRINPDGSIPADNPFADGAKARPEIISKGHRNPQGITLDTDDKTVIVVEHGARGGDEINRIVAGRNYGWPLVAYGVNYNGSRISDARTKPGYESPLHFWDPSIAPGSIAAYDGAMFPEWKGDLLVPALKFQLLSRLTRAADGTITGEERMLTDEYGRMRDIAIARDGAILIVTDDEDGAVIRISRAE